MIRKIVIFYLKKTGKIPDPHFCKIFKSIIELKKSLKQVIIETELIT